MQTERIIKKGWTLRLRRPEASGPAPVVFLLHGWKGTEDVMWVFAERIPAGFLIVAPRAPYPAPDGFSWVEKRSGEFSTLADFRPAVKKLDLLLRDLPDLFPGDYSRVHLMGFSQGAAAAYCWAALHPKRVASIAGLAGFLPEGVAEQVPDFTGMPVFIAHGSLDQIVPIEQMRTGARAIEFAGADLTVCEDAVGHKLSANCGRALGHFYSQLSDTPE